MMVDDMKINVAMRKKQSGIMLLEALIAVLIFSLGILSLVALQAASIKLTGDARHRASAALVAGKLFSEMRIQQLNAADLATQFQTDGPAYLQWRNTDVQNALGPLLDLENRPPIVIVDSSDTASRGIVTVTIFWRDTSSEDRFHQHVATTQIVNL